MKTVLVVEDSPFIAEVLKLLLEANDVNIKYLYESEKAYETVAAGGIDLVVLDLMMPKVSGKDVLLALKKGDATKKVPVLVLTARTDALKWDPEIGVCDKFMTKPFDNKELVAEITNLLNKPKT